MFIFILEIPSVTLENVTDCEDNETAGPSSAALANDPPRQPPNVSTISVHENDIGRFMDQILSDSEKKRLLNDPFCPPLNYRFPYSEHNKGNKVVKRYINQSHLDAYSWLVFSPSEQGLFCKYCAIFATSSCQGNVLVKTPLKKFAKLLGKEGDLENHQNRAYHREAVEKGKLFLQNVEQNVNIVDSLSENRRKKIEENRKKLVPIIDTIITLGRQNVALRGHRDDGDLLENLDAGNEGNFREMLKLRIRAGDTVLEDHLTSAPENATYISKTIQNEVIDCCGEEILCTIKSRLAEAGVYSVIFDETTDVSKISQVSVALRYVYEEDPREDFIGFFDLHQMNYGEDADADTEPRIGGIVLGQSVLKILRDNDIDIEYCVGVCCDTCSVNFSDICGAVNEILKFAPFAVRIPCYNHTLNLSISDSMSLPSARNLFGTIKEVIFFFNCSAKRNFVLKQILQKSLGKFCETRWVERHNTALLFAEKFQFIIDTLEKVSNWNDSVSAPKAEIYLKSLLSCQLLISLECVSHLFSLTLPLSVLFQKKTLDFKAANELVDDLLTVLKTERENVTEAFHGMFEKVSVTAAELDIDIVLPRRVGRQVHRDNHPSDSPEEYFRVSIFIPMLDHIISDIESRFKKETRDALELNVLLPDHILQLDSQTLSASLSKLWNKYAGLLSQSNTYSSLQKFESEVKLWKEKCRRLDVNISVSGALKACDKDVFPYCHILLKIFLSFASSNATSERSFSTLRRLKTWLRSTMTEDRLLGLALLHIHRDINVDIQKVIDRFASKKNRRLNIIL